MIHHIHFQRRLEVKFPKSSQIKTIYVPADIPVRLRVAPLRDFALQASIRVQERTTRFFRDDTGKLYSDALRISELGDIDRTAFLLGRPRQRKDSYLVMPALRQIEHDSQEEDAAKVATTASGMVLAGDTLLTPCDSPAIELVFYGSYRLETVNLHLDPLSKRDGLRYSFGLDDLEGVRECIRTVSPQAGADPLSLEGLAAISMAPQGVLPYDCSRPMLRALVRELLVGTESVIGRECTDTIRLWCDLRDVFDAVRDAGQDEYSLIAPSLAAIDSIKRTGILSKYVHLKSCVAELRGFGQMHDEPGIADLKL